MIIRHYLAWTHHASEDRRAEAAQALARAFLYGRLSADTARDAQAALLTLLDDPAPQVRRALAEACASCASAPRPLIIALAGDQPDVAGLVLARSPVLTDADLVDGVAIGCAITRTAIAGRRDLSYAVAGALAEIAEAGPLAAMARNRSARITTGTLLRMVERHGDDTALREALLARPDLPLEVRHTVTAQLGDSLTAFAIASGWLTPARGERANREARERTTLAFSIGAAAVDLARLVAHLKAQGQLNAGLILRAILSGRMAFAEAALADLAGLRPDRVAGLMNEASGAGFAALHRRAGLPPALLPAFTAALSAWREAGRTSETTSAALSRRMIERALTACEGMPFAEAQSVMALLSRYEAEAAREEAREVAQTLAGSVRRPPVLGSEAEILEAEWREAQRQVAHRPAILIPEAVPVPDVIVLTDLVPVAPVAAEIPVEVAAVETVDSVLDALSDALLANVRATYVAPRPPAPAQEASTLELLPQEMLTRRPPQREPEAPEVPPQRDATPVADAIPDALVASYRADRERMKLAA